MNGNEIDPVPDKVEPFDPFKDLKDFDSTPVLPAPEVVKIRLTEFAKLLDDVRIQGYIEANFGLQFLRLLQALVPLLIGLL